MPFKKPIAPPAYRPQPVPRVLQTKTMQVKAPPVYRPQPAPRVLQAKTQTKTQTDTQAKTALPFSRQMTPPFARPTAHRPSVNTQPVVQRYSTQRIPELNANAKVSTNEHYILYYDDVVYIRNAATVPPNFVLDPRAAVDSFQYNGRLYRAYKYNGGKFYKDCLHTAEELINQRELAINVDTYSRSKALGEEFGRTKPENKQLALRVMQGRHPANQAADPGIGEAYAIVGTGSKRTEFPYHAAAVVARDGNDTVTLEVCASSRDAANRNTEGQLMMYEIGGAQSFHNEYAEEYDKPITIVLVRK